MLASLQRPLSSHRYLALASRISFPTCMGPCVCRSLQVVTWGCCCDGLSSTCSLTSIIETTSRFTSPRRLVRRRTRPGCGRSLAAGFGSKTVGHPTRVAIYPKPFSVAPCYLRRLLSPCVRLCSRKFHDVREQELPLPRHCDQVWRWCALAYARALVCIARFRDAFVPVQTFSYAFD